MQLSDIPGSDKRGGLVATKRDKPQPTIHRCPVIRADLELLADRTPVPLERAPASLRQPFRKGRPRRKPRRTMLFRHRRRAAGRAGQGEPLFFAGAGLALLDACLRTDPPAAGALRSRLALQSAAASAKFLRVNVDEATLRDLSFAVGDPLGPAANLLSLWRDCAGQPPSLTPAQILDAAARLDLAVDPNGLALSLKACAGEGDLVSAAAKAAAAAFSSSRTPQRPPPKFLRSGHSTWSSPSGCVGRGPCR
jgi:Protein of unknown function (DUF1403)